MKGQREREIYDGYPRVCWVWGWQFHSDCWEAGARWGKRPFEDIEEGEILYRYRLGFQYSPSAARGFWYNLRSIFRLRWRRLK